LTRSSLNTGTSNLDGARVPGTGYRSRKMRYQHRLFR
jgi:hypothetical protein